MTPTLSVEAVQDRVIWVDEITVAASPVGTVGGVVSATAGVVAGTEAVSADRLLAASVARTVY